MRGVVLILSFINFQYQDDGGRLKEDRHGNAIRERCERSEKGDLYQEDDNLI